MLSQEDPLWYKDAVFYQLHVRAFCDSNGDGIGDLKGLISRLDYLQELGVDCIWLMPIYPSPLRDDGYDPSDYYDIHPDYGTLDDFRQFLKEAHQRGLRVIIELVLNHTSDQHPWFKEARSSPNNKYRNWYVWSQSADRYQKARVIFSDTEESNWAWDSVSRSFYWHRFFSHQPDLNYDNPEVREEMWEVMKFWLDLGVDGFRADAVPFLVEQEGTFCENLPETHEVIRFLRKRLDQNYRGKVLLAEANQSIQEVRPYLAEDEFQMALHFALTPRIFLALKQENCQPIVEILEQTQEIPASCQWGIFLRNHDQLSLEFLSEKDKDFMYKAYAADPRMQLNTGIRRRLAPLLENDPRRIKLAHSLLLTWPGSPFIYYGDEIGMGDNLNLDDRNGLRTPLQWSRGKNAGFSSAGPEKLYLPVITDTTYGYRAVNVDSQSKSPDSLLSWMKKAIKLRKSTRVFSRGKIEFLNPGHQKILAYLRQLGEESILVINNLSSLSQRAELDLSRCRGAIPHDMLTKKECSRVDAVPYILNLEPYQFLWLKLRRE